MSHSPQNRGIAYQRDSNLPTGNGEVSPPASKHAAEPSCISALEWELAEAEANRAAEEQEMALRAAKEFAAKAGAARIEAERLAAEAAEQEAAALRHVDEAFPTLAAAVQARREEEEAERLREQKEARRRDVVSKVQSNATRLLEQLSSDNAAALFGPSSSTALGKQAQKQIAAATQAAGEKHISESHRAGWAAMDDTSLPPIPFDTSDVPEWRRRPEAESKTETRANPKPFMPAPPPVKSAWVSAEKLNPKGAAPSAVSAASHRGHAAAPSPSTANYRVLNAPLGGRADVRRERNDWGARATHMSCAAKPPPLAVVQAQQAGEEEARSRLESLTEMGFAVEAAAAALLRCHGDVKAAAQSLGAQIHSRHSVAGDEQSLNSSRQPPVGESQAWRPTGTLQLMRSHSSSVSTPQSCPLPGRQTNEPMLSPADRSPSLAASAKAPPPPAWNPKIMCPSNRTAAEGTEPTRRSSAVLAPSILQPPRQQPPSPAMHLQAPARATPPSSPSLGPTPQQALARPSPPQSPSVHPSKAQAPPQMGVLSMVEKVNLIKNEISLPLNSPMAAAVKLANEKLAIVGEGPLPAQVDRLLSALGLPRATRPPQPQSSVGKTSIISAGLSTQPNHAGLGLPSTKKAPAKPGSMVVVVEHGKPLAEVLANAEGQPHTLLHDQRRRV